MSTTVIVSICINLDFRGCTNSMCIQLRIPSIFCPLLLTYARVSPARFTVADHRKLRRRKNSICVHFHIPFSYSRPFDFSYEGLFMDCVKRIILLFYRNDVRYPIWTLFVEYFTYIYDCTLNLVVWLNSIILRIDLKSFWCVKICELFGHAKICMNYCFLPIYFSAKEDFLAL